VVQQCSCCWNVSGHTFCCGISERSCSVVHTGRCNQQSGYIQPLPEQGSCVVPTSNALGWPRLTGFHGQITYCRFVHRFSLNLNTTHSTFFPCACGLSDVLQSTTHLYHPRMTLHIPSGADQTSFPWMRRLGLYPSTWTACTWTAAMKAALRCCACHHALWLSCCGRMPWWAYRSRQTSGWSSGWRAPASAWRHLTGALAALLGRMLRWPAAAAECLAGLHWSLHVRPLTGTALLSSNLARCWCISFDNGSCRAATVPERLWQVIHTLRHSLPLPRVQAPCLPGGGVRAQGDGLLHRLFPTRNTAQLL
jgi:hypothetical protein